MINNDDKFSGDEEDNKQKYDIEITKNYENGRTQMDEDDDDLEV